ncbi:hypothetical protein LY78DRAFT_593490, partial [Colletotrichum sublineola]
YYACAGVPSAAIPMPSLRPNCGRFYKVVSADSCDVIAIKDSIAVANFRRWNT